jgi:hypothetical protein
MRECIFCGGQNLTKEDAWPPKWLAKRFPVSEPVNVEAERGGIALGRWRTSSPNIRVGCVCAACNNGWMSRLENAASRIIQPLFGHQPQKLDAGSLHILAAWAIKTAMVLECINPDQLRFYSDSERAQLRSTHTVPQRACVWLAACVEQNTIYADADYLYGGKRSPELRGVATTIACDSVAIQILALRVPASVQDLTRVTIQLREGPWEEVLVPVWPVPQCDPTWPPRQGLQAESGLRALADRFSPAAGEVA